MSSEKKGQTSRITDELVALTWSQKSLPARVNNKTNNMRKIQTAMVAAMLAGALSARASFSVQELNVSPGAIVTVSTTLPGGYNGGAWAGIYNLLVGPSAVPTDSFCIDIYRLGPGGSEYDYSTLALAPTSPAGPMGAAAASNVKKLWAAYYTQATTDSDVAAALQGAIWTQVAAGAGYTTTISGTVQINALYAAMLTALPTLTTEANLVGLVDVSTANRGQNYVVPAPVPEPTTMIAGALLLLPFGTSTLRMIRKNRKA